MNVCAGRTFSRVRKSVERMQSGIIISRDGGGRGGGDELLRYRRVRSRGALWIVIEHLRTDIWRWRWQWWWWRWRRRWWEVRWWMLRRRLATICANVTVASLLLETDELCCIRELVAALAGRFRWDSRRWYNIYAGRKTYFSIAWQRAVSPFFGLLIYDGAPSSYRVPRR